MRFTDEKNYCVAEALVGGLRSGMRVVETASDGTRETLPGLGLAMDALDAPAMPLIETLLPLAPLNPLAPRSQEGQMIDIEDDDMGVSRGADTARRSGQPLQS